MTDADLLTRYNYDEFVPAKFEPWLNGENYPHLTSMEQKFRHTRALRDVLGVTRPILVDALDLGKRLASWGV